MANSGKFKVVVIHENDFELLVDHVYGIKFLEKKDLLRILKTLMKLKKHKYSKTQVLETIKPLRK